MLAAGLHHRTPRFDERSGSRNWSVLVGNRLTLLVGVLLILMGFVAGRASDRDETVVTVQVSSADHEVMEGYFALGDSMTLMAKPGSDVYRFLGRQRGRKIKITMTEEGGPTLSRLQRDGR